jgi:hypothetical protein
MNGQFHKRKSSKGSRFCVLWNQDSESVESSKISLHGNRDKPFQQWRYLLTSTAVTSLILLDIGQRFVSLNGQQTAVGKCACAPPLLVDHDVPMNVHVRIPILRLAMYSRYLCLMHSRGSLLLRVDTPYMPLHLPRGPSITFLAS